MIVSQTFIARKTGVSQKTVSLYFKDRALVGETVRKRLDEVVQKYHYLPNFAAHAMKTAQFHRIGCVLLQYGSPETSIQAQLMSYLNGATTALAGTPYSLVLEPVFFDPVTQQISHSDFFSMRSANGVIGISGGWVPPEVDERIARLQLPTVWLNRNPGDSAIRSLVFDEQTAMIELLERILTKAVKRVCWIGPEFQSAEVHFSRRLRYETLRKECGKRGVACEGILFDSTREESVTSALQQVLQQEQHYDVLFFYNFYFMERLMWLAGSDRLRQSHKTVTCFLSAGEYSAKKCDYSGTILLPETELGRRGAEFILSCLTGKEDPSLLTPCSCRLL